MERLRLGWLPGDPISEQRVEMCEGDEVTSYAYTEGRVQLRQVEDPDHRWARGAGTGWRQRTLEARRLEWRTGDDGVVVFQRIGDSVTWVTAIGFSPEETLRAAASLTAM